MISAAGYVGSGEVAMTKGGAEAGPACMAEEWFVEVGAACSRGAVGQQRGRAVAGS